MGRPAPYMIYRNMIDLNILSAKNVLKVGDTIEDIREGYNANVQTVGVIIGSNELGLSLDEFKESAATDLEEKMTKTRNKMFAAGADFVINSIAGLPEVIRQINE
jgi:phosphonoacetaldehyde hydrolase